MSKRLNFEIDNIIIDEIHWTLKNFIDKFKEWEATPYWERDNDKNPYKQAAHAMLITAKIGFGDCFPIDKFIQDVEDGYFMDYDGSGYFVNEDGNQISSIRCNAEWLRNHTPEAAKFVMWFNK